jgi:endoglucanase
VRSLIQAAWEPLADEVSLSRVGSLHALRRGLAPEPRPSILLAAHMDAIGFMVTTVVDGFLRFTRIGGHDPRVLPGQAVTVFGRQPLPGYIVQPPARLLPAHVQEGTLPMEYLWIDVGLTPADVSRWCAGDGSSLNRSWIPPARRCVFSDNRASVVVVTTA